MRVFRVEGVQGLRVLVLGLWGFYEGFCKLRSFNTEFLNQLRRSARASSTRSSQRGPAIGVSIGGFQKGLGPGFGF